MEEIYILSDGSQVDLSGKSQFEKTNFLIKNPTAKKQKGVAKSADVAPKKNQALNNAMGSSSTTGSLGSTKKYRLADDNDFETMQKRGLVPPPSAMPKVNVNLDNLYSTTSELIEKESKEDFKLAKNKKLKSLLENKPIFKAKNFRAKVK